MVFEDPLLEKFAEWEHRPYFMGVENIAIQPHFFQ
jgi:hypothetical protein